MGNTAAQRVAIITGAGTGIGAAIARRFAVGGDALVLVGLQEASLQDLAGEIGAQGGTAVALACDLADSNSRAALFKLVDDRFGRVDTLVNNAGISGPDALGPAYDETEEHHARMLAVNLTAAYFLAQAAGRRMRDAGRGGAIVNISSVGGVAAQMYAASYCITKAGMDAMVRSLAIEWADDGIRANSVAPGDIETETSEAAGRQRKDLKIDRTSNPLTRGTPGGRRGRPEDVAEMVWFLASDAAAFVTGESLRVDGGYLAY